MNNVTNSMRDLVAPKLTIVEDASGLIVVGDMMESGRGEASSAIGDSHLEHAAGFVREDAPEERLRKLQDFLGRTGTPAENVVLFADLLFIPARDGLPSLELSPQRRKEKTFEALFRQIKPVARQTPVMLLVEDAHWLDPSSRELLDLTIERLSDPT